MNALERLRNSIEVLPTSSTPEELEIWKRNALMLVESVLPVAGSSEPMLHARLSPREHQVMSMLLEGKRLKEIAARLEISVKTVTTHRARLLRKLAIEDNLSLYRYAIRHGLISA